MTNTVGTSAEDVKTIWPAVTSYFSDADIERYLPVALFEFQNDLEKAGKEYAKYTDLSKAKYALAYKCISEMAAAQVMKGNPDKWVWMVDYFKEKYGSALAGLDFPYDSDGDGTADTEERTVETHVVIAR